MGFEKEILELMRKMVLQPKEQRKGNITKSKRKRELRKLECTINYNEKDHNREGRDTWNLLLKLK